MRDPNRVPWNKGLKVQTNTGRTHFKKGMVSLRKGKKLPMSIRKKVSDTLKRKGIIPPSQKGRTPWNKGHGNQPVAVRVRRTAEYAEWRKKVFCRDNYTCKLCNERGGKIVSDHIKSFAIIIGNLSYEETMEIEELWDIRNGRTLCEQCHRKTDTYGYKTRKKLYEKDIQDRE